VKKRIGLAVGNSVSRIATPLKTINNISSETSCEKILNEIKEWSIHKIIIGKPEIYSDQKINKKIDYFGNVLKKSLDLDIIFYNEDFTSNSAQASLALQRQAGRKKRVNKEEIDRIAASIILQSYFENEIFKRSDTGTTSKD
jgi:putative Holliday junction resolvase